MMVVVTFVSLAVHVYTIGYMHDDPGYQRFFSYISLFTFSMLMLVMSNNFLQLFFGWEAVGVVSYLLIGFWYTRPTAIFANLKAFLVNRVGDFGFLLGIAALATYTGTLDYSLTFEQADRLASTSIEIFSGAHWSLLTFACICLFVGAMGKSAQMPLHVWLPDSMEGPTPISALIHAATMVTAGIFMVARMSPLFEHSEVALSVVITIGAITAFFTGLLGIVQQDIKRVIAYSTLSQLGYMTVALGASAYAAGIFHLMTHAFFKALLFLAAGSVIIAMHHEQDIRKMGGLRKIHADHVLDVRDRHARADRIPGIRRFLLEGRADRGRARVGDAGPHARVLGRPARRVRDVALQLPAAVRRVPRRRSAWITTRRSTCTRRPLVVLAAAHGARDPVRGHRLAHRRPGAVRRLVRRLDLRAVRARSAARAQRGVPRPARVHGRRVQVARRSISPRPVRWSRGSCI